MTKFENSLYRAVDYKKIYEKANELLVSTHAIDSFPFNVKSFVKAESDVAICSFDKARKYNVPIEKLGSNSALLTELNGRYIIFYNQDEPSNRVKFSILHEFAHYLFGHEMNFKDKNYDVKEIEANCFAAQILMPEQLLRECASRGQKLDKNFISQAFGVSGEAAEKRVRTLAKTNWEWRSREKKEFDDVILEKYSKTLEKIAPKKFNKYEFEDEYERQKERDYWLSLR